MTIGVRWDVWEVGLLLSAFTAAQLAYYSCLPYMLKLSTAAELHLSHLATDFYSILAGVFLFQTNVSNARKPRFIFLYFFTRKAKLISMSTRLPKQEQKKHFIPFVYNPNTKINKCIQIKGFVKNDIPIMRD